MTEARCSDEEFIRRFNQIGATALSKELNIGVRAVFLRRRNLERLHGVVLDPKQEPQHAARLHFDVLNGIVLVGSDAHLWPGPPTTAMRAFVKFCKELSPRLVVLNGDVVDLPQISRHSPIGWEKRPTVADEIDSAKERLAKIEDAAPRNAKHIWTLGNHDGRFETRLATVAPEYARLHGVHLKDHFPAWSACWSAWVNGDVVIKHRYKGGIHATHNNTVYSGKHIVTGHLHSAKVTPWTDYNGTRYGMDTGCLADPDADAFTDYLEDGPRNWRSAFGVLTFHKGELLYPELVLVHSKKTVQFRGQIIEV